MDAESNNDPLLNTVLRWMTNNLTIWKMRIDSAPCRGWAYPIWGSVDKRRSTSCSCRRDYSLLAVPTIFYINIIESTCLD